MHWLSHFFGLDNLSGPFYGFWSGVGSDIAELTLAGALIEQIRRRNCHVSRCWRSGHFEVGGTPYKTCRKHHPEVPDLVTPDEVADAAESAAKGRGVV